MQGRPKCGSHVCRLFSTLALQLAVMIISTGCATIDGPPDPNDPLERFNRAMYQFNDDLDRTVLKPAAKGYAFVVPAPIDRGVTNVFGNVGDIVVLFNDLLQFKFVQGASDAGRVIINSTLGLLGLFDVATGLGLEKHNEDFGQTLGYWGLGSGPYIVLPFFGPSTVRDGAGLAVDYVYFDPVFTQIDDPAVSWGLFALDTVDARADALSVTKILEQAALDPYVFTREAYLQRRRYLVYDGQPPPVEEDAGASDRESDE